MSAREKQPQQCTHSGGCRFFGKLEKIELPPLAVSARQSCGRNGPTSPEAQRPLKMTNDKRYGPAGERIYGNGILIECNREPDYYRVNFERDAYSVCLLPISRYARIPADGALIKTNALYIKERKKFSERRGFPKISQCVWWTNIHEMFVLEAWREHDVNLLRRRF